MLYYNESSLKYKIKKFVIYEARCNNSNDDFTYVEKEKELVV